MVVRVVATRRDVVVDDHHPSDLATRRRAPPSRSHRRGGALSDPEQFIGTKIGEEAECELWQDIRDETRQRLTVALTVAPRWQRGRRFGFVGSPPS